MKAYVQKKASTGNLFNENLCKEVGSVRRAKRMDRAQVSISGRMDKQIVEYLYNGKLLCQERNELSMCCNMTEPQKLYPE